MSSSQIELYIQNCQYNLLALTNSIENDYHRDELHGLSYSSHSSNITEKLSHSLVVVPSIQQPVNESLQSYSHDHSYYQKK